MELSRPIQSTQILCLLSLLTTTSVAYAQTTGEGFSLELRIGAPTTSEVSPEPSALDQGIAGLSSSDPQERLEAVRTLGELGDPAAVEPLANAALTDPRPEIRGWAVRALHRIGTPQALDTIRLVGENDTDERVRTLAEGLIGPVAPPVEVAVEEEAEAAVEATEAPVDQSGLWEIPPPSTPSVQTNIVVQNNQPQSPLVPPPQTAAPDQMYDYQAQLLEARRLRRAGLGLRIAGWTVFGLTYFPALMAGISISATDDEDGWPLIIPVFGPIIAGARIFDDGGDSHNGLGILSVAWGLLQAAGLAMAIGGHVRRRRARRQAAESGFGRQPPQRQVSLLPAGPGDGPGLGLAATF